MLARLHPPAPRAMTPHWDSWGLSRVLTGAWCGTEKSARRLTQTSLKNSPEIAPQSTGVHAHAVPVTCALKSQCVSSRLSFSCMKRGHSARTTRTPPAEHPHRQENPAPTGRHRSRAKPKAHTLHCLEGSPHANSQGLLFPSSVRHQ